jgi:hypothetical protein
MWRLLDAPGQINNRLAWLDAGTVRACMKIHDDVQDDAVSRGRVGEILDVLGMIDSHRDLRMAS